MLAMGASDGIGQTSRCRVRPRLAPITFQVPLGARESPLRDIELGEAQMTVGPAGVEAQGMFEAGSCRRFVAGRVLAAPQIDEQLGPVGVVVVLARAL